MPPPPALIEALTTVVDNTRWRLVLLAGVVGILSGLVALLHPDATLFVLAACVATYLLALLVARIPGISVLLGFDAGPRFVRSLLGLLALIGVLLVVDAQLATTLAVVIGFMEYVLLSVAASVAIASRYSGVRRLLAAEAVTVAASAAAVVLWARIDVDAVATVVGVYLVVRGALDCVIAVVVSGRRSRQP
jgi:hypothetical protein